MFGIDEKLPALEEQRAAAASQLSICHDSNSVSEEISFIPENQQGIIQLLQCTQCYKNADSTTNPNQPGLTELQFETGSGHWNIVRDTNAIFKINGETSFRNSECS